MDTDTQYAEALSTRIIATGCSVIDKEAAALAQLSGTIDIAFSDAVAMVLNTDRRVIVSGIGKSGHIARKIAATLASTGTAAFFIHPAEAAHGDLGMMLPGDCLLIFSNSGKTRELNPVVEHARNLDIPVICVASGKDGPLAREADVALILPNAPEACLVNLAPTTSTTMMLALGDALAVSVMEQRGLRRRDIARWHPGGEIGWRMMPVSQILRSDTPLPLVREHARMRDVISEMTTVGKGVAGVVDEDGLLVGIITDGDVRRSFDHIMIATARDVMTSSPILIDGSTLIEEARDLMASAKITVMFVIDGDEPRRPIGLLHIHDLSPHG